MSKKQKKRLGRIGLGALLFIIAILAEKLDLVKNNNALVIMYLAAYLVTGGDVIKKAARNIRNGQVFDENFLMVIASLGAFLISEMSEAAGVMLFYQIGEFFQDYAVNSSRKSIASLMDIRPDTARVKRDGNIEEVSPEEVKKDEIIVIRPGDRIPLDAVIVSGSSMLDTVAITGESVPRSVKEGDELISGCINIIGVLEARVACEYSESTVARILELVENASSRKAVAENFITKFARYYTPAVVACAALLAIVPSIVTGQPSVWIYRALSFLVISCPCALVISVPLSFFGGLGGASSKGILIKGSNYLEALARTDTVVFDKTGTLTKGVFAVTELLPSSGFSEKYGREGSQSELLRLAALAEGFSTHPIALSIIKAAEEKGLSLDGKKPDPSNIKEHPGLGISALIDGHTISCGNKKLMDELNIEIGSEWILPDRAGALVYVASDKSFAGLIHISDEVKEDSKSCIQGLKELGIKTVMLTGDRKGAADLVSKLIGIDETWSELLPTDKVQITEKLLADEKNGGKLAFVGDGINDAPVLARADIGVAMGGVGSDAAIEAADVVLMTDEPSKLLTGISISKKTLRIVKENIIFAIGVKILTLILAAAGIATMWAAVFADVGVSVIAILNSLRSMKVK